MEYLAPAEYEAYGVEATTPTAWISGATSLVNAHCRRVTLAVAQFTERLRLSVGRNTVRLTYLPLATVAPATTPVVTARARYGSLRRGENVMQSEWSAELMNVFALPGTWTNLDGALIDFFAETGELTLPTNVLGLSYSELEITYMAGLSPIPDAVKNGCAQIVRNALATPALNVRRGRLDRMHLEYFADTLIDQSVRALLAPYVAQKVG